jgi:hypothetical protein
LNLAQASYSELWLDAGNTDWKTGAEVGLGRRSREARCAATVAKLAGNRKGCDFGYALAAASCEGATGVDACTVTALGAITAFAVPDPG